MKPGPHGEEFLIRVSWSCTPDQGLRVALQRIGQVDTDTGMVGDDYCAECGGWTQRDWTVEEVDSRVSCGSDCPGRIARRALAADAAAEAQ